jgi:hypothetical protein
MRCLCRMGYAVVLASFCGCAAVDAEHVVSQHHPTVSLAVLPLPVTTTPAEPTKRLPPQVMADISADLLRIYVEKPIDRVMPISDEVLGASVTGTGTTHARATAELVPCESHAAFDLIAAGRTWTEAVSRKRPVSLWSRGVIDFTVRTRVYLDQAGFRNEPPVAAARNHMDLTGISSDLARILDPIILRVAKRQYEKSKPQALEIADQRAEQRYVEQTAMDLAPEIAKGNESFTQKLADLENRNLRLDSLRMRSSATAITVSATIAGFALPVTPAPTYATPGDLGLRIHEGVLTTLAARELAGKTLTPEKIDARIEEITGKKRGATEKSKPFSVTFPKADPVSVRFDKHKIETVAHIESFTSDGEDYRGVDVTIRYRLVRSATGFFAVRETIDVYPPGYVPGSGKSLSARQLATARVMKDRLAEQFKEQIPLEELKLTGSFEKLGPLEVVATGTQSGWLLIAWKRKAGGQ